MFAVTRGWFANNFYEWHSHEPQLFTYNPSKQTKQYYSDSIPWRWFIKLAPDAAWRLMGFTGGKQDFRGNAYTEIIICGYGMAKLLDIPWDSLTKAVQCD